MKIVILEGSSNRNGSSNMLAGEFAKGAKEAGHEVTAISAAHSKISGFGDASNGQHSWTLDEEHSREIIKRGLELGVNFFDTAIGYQSGTSEQYVGKALWDFAKRDEVVVATKFLPRTQEDIAAGITGQQHIERMVNASLANLGMDYVDLYIYHMWDYQTPLYDIMENPFRGKYPQMRIFLTVIFNLLILSKLFQLHTTKILSPILLRYYSTHLVQNSMSLI